MSQNPYTEEPNASASVETKVAELKTALTGFHSAVLTTRDPNSSRLHSRSMHCCSTKNLEFIFFADRSAGKISGINKDHDANIAYFKDGSTWISIAGKASVSNDRAKIKELYSPMLRAWWSDRGEDHPKQRGDAEDERMVLITVQPEEIRYFVQKRTTVGMMADVVTAIAGERTAEPGDCYALEGGELEQAKKLMG